MRILITGVSTRAIAESACAAGYDVITLDYFGDLDQKRLCQNYSLKRDFGLPFGPAQLYRASRNLEFDALVYISNLENYPDIVERLTAGVRGGGRKQLLGNSPAVLARVRHWPIVADALRRQGQVPVGLEIADELQVGRLLRRLPEGDLQIVQKGEKQKEPAQPGDQRPMGDGPQRRRRCGQHGPPGSQLLAAAGSTAGAAPLFCGKSRNCQVF